MYLHDRDVKYFFPAFSEINVLWKNVKVKPFSSIICNRVDFLNILLATRMRTQRKVTYIEFRALSFSNCSTNLRSSK